MGSILISATMKDKDILRNNVSNYHKQVMAAKHPGHSDPGLDFWQELNERIYDGIVFERKVIPEPKCYIAVNGTKVEVEAQPRRLKAFYSWYNDSNVSEDDLLKCMAASAAFDLNQLILAEPPGPSKIGPLFVPYLMAFRTLSFLDPADVHCSTGIRTRFAMVPR